MVSKGNLSKDGTIFVSKGPTDGEIFLLERKIFD